jgi:hypothetical protein
MIERGNLRDAILASPEGGTLVRYMDGLAPWVPSESARFAVGDGRIGARVPADDLAGLEEACAQVLAADGFDAVGWWSHDGVVYVDPVTLAGSREHALRLARERGELAVWDGVEGAEVAS